MTVEQVPGEMRWWVSSESRDMNHLVDLTYQEERWNRPRPVCSCEESFIKGHVCKHIFKLVNHLLTT